MLRLCLQVVRLLDDKLRGLLLELRVETLLKRHRLPHLFNRSLISFWSRAAFGSRVHVASLLVLNHGALALTFDQRANRCVFALDLACLLLRYELLVKDAQRAGSPLRSCQVDNI